MCQKLPDSQTASRSFHALTGNAEQHGADANEAENRGLNCG